MDDRSTLRETWERLGDPGRLGSWQNYRLRGASAEHIPELIQLALDPSYNTYDSEDPRVWTPLHAWRALGQLRAVEALPPLFEVFDRQVAVEDDWAFEELPVVFGMIGAPALPALEKALADTQWDERARNALTDAFPVMAKDFSETRSECIRILTNQLERGTGEERDLNGFITAALLDMEAVEAAPVIERAFAEGRITEDIAGDWPVCQYELGLLEEPPPYYRNPGQLLPPPDFGPRLNPRARAKQRAKAKRKEADKSRKRNRKKRK